tara:strand:+ start:1299 stop:1874 length:576 start_codon:yes stop_codon:yes gene_type:complete
MAFSLKGFGKAKNTDDSNNMTKGAAIKMTASPVMRYSPIQQSSGTSTKPPKDDLFATDESGATVGIRGTTFDEEGNRQTYVPDPESLRKIRERNKSGDLPKYEDYKGNVVMGDNDRVRGLMDDKGNFTRFVNPTSRDRLTKNQRKQLQDFEKTRDQYNRRQSENRRFQKALIEYPETGKTARRVTSTKKKK